MPQTAPSSIPSSPPAPSPIRAPTAAPNASASSASRSLLLDRLDHAVLGLPHGEQVDEADDVAVAQPLELGADLPVELGSLKAITKISTGPTVMPRTYSCADVRLQPDVRVTAALRSSALHCPAAASEFIRARCRNAACAASTFAGSPPQAASADACSARPYEYESGQGRRRG